MSKRIDRRISEIKSERTSLLEMVKNNLADSGSMFSEYLDQIIKALVIDEESIKKYSVYVDAQNMIVSLLQDISEAKTKEEVVEIRKRINYYINKIKEEIKKRNINTTTIDRYQEEASKVREQITKAVRILRRNTNLELIDNLYSRIDELNEEELNTLKKALSREKSFNTNFSKPSKKKTKKPEQDSFSAQLAFELDQILKAHHRDEEEVKPIRVEKPIVVHIEDKKEDEPVPPKDNIFFPELEELLTRIKNEPSQSTHTFVNVGDMDFEEVQGDIVKSSTSLNNRYGIREIRDYGEKKIKNFTSLLLNIPNIIHNKRAIKRMKKDYCNFYRGDDLAGVIEYQRDRNSIKQALKCIFSSSHLHSKEVEYLNRHDDCSRWLYDFFKANSMSIPVQKAYHM